MEIVKSAAAGSGRIRRRMLQATGLSNTAATELLVLNSPPKTMDGLGSVAFRSGLLQKRDAQGEWHQRQCMIVPHTFLYYFDDDVESPRKIIDLEHYSRVEAEDDLVIRLSTSDEISAPDLFFRLENDAQVSDWLTALNRESRLWKVAAERDAYRDLQHEFSEQVHLITEALSQANQERQQAQADAARLAAAQAEHVAQVQALLAFLEDDSGIRAGAASSNGLGNGSLANGSLHSVLAVLGQLISQMSQDRHQLEVRLLAVQNEAAAKHTRLQESHVAEVAALEREVAAQHGLLLQAGAQAEGLGLRMHELEQEVMAARAESEENRSNLSIVAATCRQAEAKVKELQEHRRVLVKEVKAARRALAQQEADRANTILQYHDIISTAPHDSMALDAAPGGTGSARSRAQSAASAPPGDSRPQSRDGGDQAQRRRTVGTTRLDTYDRPAQSLAGMGSSSKSCGDSPSSTPGSCVSGPGPGASRGGGHGWLQEAIPVRDMSTGEQSNMCLTPRSASEHQEGMESGDMAAKVRWLLGFRHPADVDRGDHSQHGDTGTGASSAVNGGSKAGRQFSTRDNPPAAREAGGSPVMPASHGDPRLSLPNLLGRPRREVRSRLLDLDDYADYPPSGMPTPPPSASSASSPHTNREVHFAAVPEPGPGAWHSDCLPGERPGSSSVHTPAAKTVQQARVALICAQAEAEARQPPRDYAGCLRCQACGGTVEGPLNSTCRCSVPCLNGQEEEKGEAGPGLRSIMHKVASNLIDGTRPAALGQLYCSLDSHVTALGAVHFPAPPTCPMATDGPDSGASQTTFAASDQYTEGFPVAADTLHTPIQQRSASHPTVYNPSVAPPMASLDGDGGASQLQSGMLRKLSRHLEALAALPDGLRWGLAAPKAVSLGSAGQDSDHL